MVKVMVIGCPGAGKSTFARKLHAITGLPLYYLDQIWHKPDRTNISKEDFDQKLTAIIQTDRWIIDGNYSRTLEPRLMACDTVFLLDYPLDVCLSGAQARIGKKRDDMPWIEDTLDDEFRQWIVDFPQTQLPAIYQLLERYQKEKTVIIFRSRKQADEYIAQLPHTTGL